jgi:hypothetical protein
MGEWYTIGFKIKWDKISSPNFVVDLFIIDLLINPAVKNFKSDLILWRFHRRAARDDAGHELKFIFYTSSKIAEQVFNYIRSNDFYDIIINNYTETTGVNLSVYNKEVDSCKIEATSDSAWPLEIQKTWPYYIMGVCDMFINFIEEIKKSKDIKIDKNNLKQTESSYKEIEQEITKQWFGYGQHAFLHHLGAIFAYNPIKFKSRDTSRPGEVSL